MHAERLIIIAQEMGKLYTELRRNEFQTWQLENDIEARKVFMAPEGGWPGKNESERKAASEKSYTTDEALCKMADQRLKLRLEHAEADGRLQARDAERRALEWVIREQLVARYSPQVLETAEPVDNAIEKEIDEGDFGEGPTWYSPEQEKIFKETSGKLGIPSDNWDIPF